MRSRDARRDKQVAERWAYPADPMRRDLAGQGLWLDTSQMDVRATVEEIERRWQDAVLSCAEAFFVMADQGSR